VDTDRWLVRTDGSRPHKTRAMGVGLVAYEAGGDGGQVFRLSEFVGRGTPALAEYLAITRALEEALERGVSGVDIECDSLSVVQQLDGTAHCKKAELIEQKRRIGELRARFANGVTITHICDLLNTEADTLARKASKRKY
jgi:ribonuclease HI